MATVRIKDWAVVIVKDFVEQNWDQFCAYIENWHEGVGPEDVVDELDGIDQ